MVSLAKSLKSKWVSIVVEALSPRFSAGLPWELLYADDLVMMADSLDELSVKLERWKAELSAKCLKVNTKKTKTMISKPGAGPVQKTQGNTHAVFARKVLGVTQYNVPNVNNGYMLDAAVSRVNSPKSKILSAIHVQVHLETHMKKRRISSLGTAHMRLSSSFVTLVTCFKRRWWG